MPRSFARIGLFFGLLFGRPFGLPFIAAIALALPSVANAWGDKGHAVIALIAEHHLRPAVRQQVLALLATDPSGLAPTDIAHQATWADRFRDADRDTTRAHYEQTRQWHFANIELSSPDLDAACFGLAPLPLGAPASRGPARDCVVAKIDQFMAELSHPATAPDERRLALQFLLHFVGDLHQPLHAADDHDAGGNGKLVRIDREEGTAGEATRKLHALWDSDFVTALGRDPQQVATKLIARIKPAQAARWREGSSRTWAMESFGVARRVAYGALPAPGADGVVTLSPQYLRRGREAAALQLSRAGVRLAELLNRAFR